jgi:hypothetical protein
MTETETKWADRVREWEEGEKTAEEFTAGQPYKASTLRWWRTEIRRRSGGGARRSKDHVGESIPMVRVVRRTRQRAPESMVVEVSGARISVERGFDAELLSEVVRALGRAR